MTTPESAVPDERTVFSLQAAWSPDVGMAPPQVSNVFLTQVVPDPDGQPGLVVISAGYVGPPLVSGTPDQQRAQMAEIEANGGVLPVFPLARFAMTRNRTQELRDLLTQLLDSMDENTGRTS